MVLDKGIVYYTDDNLPADLARKARKQILKSGLPIVSVSLNKPLDFGINIQHDGERGWTTMYEQVLKGLKVLETPIVFLCEHDILYHPSHFEFEPSRRDIYYYDNNCWKYNLKTGQVVSYDCRWASQICTDREILISHYKKKIHLMKTVEHRRRLKTSPGTNPGIDNYKTKTWLSDYPSIDVKHGTNLAGVRRFVLSDFRNAHGCRNWKESTIDNIPGWNLREMVSL